LILDCSLQICATLSLGIEHGALLSRRLAGSSWQPFDFAQDRQAAVHKLVGFKEEGVDFLVWSDFNLLASTALS
jgi:hypothetical protein